MANAGFLVGSRSRIGDCTSKDSNTCVFVYQSNGSPTFSCDTIRFWPCIVSAKTWLITSRGTCHKCFWSAVNEWNVDTVIYLWIILTFLAWLHLLLTLLCPSLSLSLLRPDITPQWGAADADIKVPSGENTELKRSPFQAWNRSVYSHTCYAYRQGVRPCLFLPFQSIHLHFLQNLSHFFPVLACRIK